MTFRYLDKDGALSFWTNIKNYILSKIPTKTSEIQNDSGYLTSHQSLSNYVTLNSNQTITAIKTITGGNQGKMVFKNPNFTVGTTPESGTTVTRIYFGGGTSYNGSTGAISNDIASNGNSQLEICALNNNSSNSYRTSLILRYEQDQTRPRFIKSWGDFCPYSDNTYYLGRSDSVWKECYCNAYYLGTTAFGDIVTHNASEFLTSADLLPIGSYIQFAGSQPPDGFLVCNGGKISRTTYSALFAVIGTTYGSGDGSKTFNLPNLTNRFLQGSSTSGTVKNAGLPNITGSYSAYSLQDGAPSSCFSSQISTYSTISPAGSAKLNHVSFEFNASGSNSIYGSSSTVQPPALTCLICIKY